jgi:hypothetical protein
VPNRPRQPALLESAFLSEVSGSSAGALAAPGEGSYAADTEARVDVVQAKPGAAEPAWRHRGVRARQMLAVVLLLVIGGLLAAYFLAPPEHSMATRTVTVRTASAGTLAQVPDVVNHQQESALATLGTAGFESRVKRRRLRRPASSSKKARRPGGRSEGDQRSPCWSPWARPSQGGSRHALVPSVLRLDKTVAQGILTAAGLGSRIEFVASGAAAGRVISQSPPEESEPSEAPTCSSRLRGVASAVTGGGRPRPGQRREEPRLDQSRPPGLERGTPSFATSGKGAVRCRPPS